MEQAVWKTETQEDMEDWFQRYLRPDAYIFKKGIIASMHPQFVKCNYSKKTVTFAFEVMEWQLNPEGILHGGMLMTAFDTAFGLLCHYYSKQNVINTIELGTTFLKPVPAGCTYHITVSATHVGKTLTSMTAEAYLPEKDFLLATASSSFMRLERKVNNIPPQ